MWTPRYAKLVGVIVLAIGLMAGSASVAGSLGTMGQSGLDQIIISLPAPIIFNPGQ